MKRRYWCIRHADNENLYLASLTGPGMQRWAHDEREAKQFPSEGWAVDVMNLLLGGRGHAVEFIHAGETI